MNKSTLNRRIVREKVGKLLKTTHFNAGEIERLLKMHEKKMGNDRILTKEKFKQFIYVDFNITMDFMLNRIYEVFDKETRGGVCDEDFVRGLSVFVRGTLTEKIAFAFSCYDLNKDQYLSKEEIFYFLKPDNGRLAQDEEDGEAIRDMVDIVIKKMDHDHDSKISLDDYTKTVMKDILTLEYLGACLPKPETTEVFLQLISDESKEYSVW